MVLYLALFRHLCVVASSCHRWGPIFNELFDRNLVAIETMALLLSSFTCGLAMIVAKRGNMVWTLGWLAEDHRALLGLVFLYDRNVREFASMIAEEAGPQRRAVRLVLLHAGWLSRCSCTAGLLWIWRRGSADLERGFRRASSRGCCASVFSGMPSTSSG